MAFVMLHPFAGVIIKDGSFQYWGRVNGSSYDYLDLDPNTEEDPVSSDLVWEGIPGSFAFVCRRMLTKNWANSAPYKKWAWPIFQPMNEWRRDRLR